MLVRTPPIATAAPGHPQYSAAPIFVFIDLVILLRGFAGYLHLSLVRARKPEINNPLWNKPGG
jgi:hypothetical protein